MTLENALQEMIDAFGVKRTHEMIDAFADAFEESIFGEKIPRTSETTKGPGDEAAK